MENYQIRLITLHHLKRTIIHIKQDSKPYDTDSYQA